MVKTAFYKGIYIEQHFLFDDRPTLVFLHDSLGCVQLWRDFPTALANATQCNIFMYDRLGYGKSEPMESWVRPVNYMEIEARVLNELLQHFNVKKPILFGHSDGGTIALLTASIYPQTIYQTIVEAAHIFVEEVTLKGVNNAIDTYAKSNLNERLQKYHGNKSETIFKAWTQTWIRADYRSWNIENLLVQIQSPLLFIQGENDEYGSVAQVEQTLNKLQGVAEKFMLPNIGHSPHKEAVEEVLKATTNFILSNL